jgi:transcriptional regulator with XRE-family HTH domain
VPDGRRHSGTVQALEGGLTVPTTRKQQIAQLVRNARTEKGWTQAYLAERVGVNTQTISHIERAMHMPSRLGLLERLEDTLDVDLSAEAQVGHAILDEIVSKLTERMRDLGPMEGLRLAADVLDVVESWKPRRRPGEG